MYYRGIKYHKITDSTLIFYELDNHISSDINFFKKISTLLEIVSFTKPEFLIINRIGSTYKSENNILEITDVLLIENFKKYGIRNIFVIESEKENNLSKFEIKSNFVIKLKSMTDVFDYLKQPA